MKLNTNKSEMFQLQGMGKKHQGFMFPSDGMLTLYDPASFSIKAFWGKIN